MDIPIFRDLRLIRAIQPDVLTSQFHVENDIEVYWNVLDVDECALELHDCSKHANCTNTKGAFNCTCIDGYRGDGWKCIGK